MVNFVKRIKYKIRSVKSDIHETVKKLKIYIIVMSALQIFTFLIVITLLILYIVRS
jgi:hypothetical protein